MTDEQTPARTSERRGRHRRRHDRDVLDMATVAHETADQALRAINAHTQECATFREGIKFQNKLILAVLASGTVLLLTGMGTVAWALFEFIIHNPHLLKATAAP